jgi:general secretion pathway protein E
MARLDIAEKRLPQDGRIATKLGGRAVDLRVSTIPSSFGERVVMRLLDKSAGRLNLVDLGLPDAQLQTLKGLLNKPHGILLVTGPTGSGKTTTLYAGLSRLNDNQRNIMTIEDPVEYNIEGINQTQVNTKADMTFAKGLRAILRQDPDVVMIGEIRDIETAQIAVMAQRLVRRLCPHCKTAHPADEAECEVLGVSDATLYQADGCDHCQQTGYQGRIGIYELIAIDEALRQMIHSDASEIEMDRYAHQKMPSIHQSGIQLVLNGETSLEEVLRVTQQ